MSREKITLYMETTKKNPEDTLAEIQKILCRYNLKTFAASYDGGKISGCIFAVEIGNRQIPFRMPVKWEPLWKLAREGRTRYIRNEHQAQCVAWRQVLRWIEAQLALVDTCMADFHEVFLPYIVNKEGLTVFQKFSENNFRGVLTAGSES